MKELFIRFLYVFSFIGTLHFVKWLSGFESAVFCGMCIIFLILSFPFKDKKT